MSRHDIALIAFGASLLIATAVLWLWMVGALLDSAMRSAYIPPLPQRATDCSQWYDNGHSREWQECMHVGPK